MKKILYVFCGLIFFCIQINAQSRLMGICNNLTTGSNIGSSRPANVSIQDTDYTNVKGSSIAPWTPSTPLKLPVRVNIQFSKGEPYVIRIAEQSTRGDCPGETNRVVAEILGKTASTPGVMQEVCLTNAISRGIIGREVFGFQNVFLFLADNPDYDEAVAGSIPFKFAISAWTTTKYPWNKRKINHPADNNKITFTEPLRVIQGHAAFGGGLTPRIGHANIAHIYNNSPKILFLVRNSHDKELIKYNFEKLIPPYSAMPFAMVWVPKVTQAGFDGYNRSEIKLFAMQVPKAATDLPPVGFEFISEVGSYELEPTVPKVEELISQFTRNTPNIISDILGEQSYDEMLKSSTERYFIGKNYFQMLTNSGTNKIYIQKTPLGDDNGTNMQVVGPACAGRLPNYFKLTVSEDSKGKVIPKIESIPEEEIYEYN